MTDSPPPTAAPRAGRHRRAIGYALTLIGVSLVLYLLPTSVVVNIRDVGLILAATAGNLFVIGFGILVPWYDSPAARNIMGMMASTAALLDLNLAALILGRDYDFRPYAGVYIYFPLAIFAAQRFRMMWLAQVTVPRKEKLAALLAGMTEGASMFRLKPSARHDDGPKKGNRMTDTNPAAGGTSPDEDLFPDAPGEHDVLPDEADDEFDEGIARPFNPDADELPAPREEVDLDHTRVYVEGTRTPEADNA